MDITGSANSSKYSQRKTNQNIQVYVRVRPLNTREHIIKSTEVVEVTSPKEIVARHAFDLKLAKRFTFDRTFGTDSRQVEVYSTVVAPLIEEVLAGYNCTIFAYGQTGTGKTHTMVGNECAELRSTWEDDSEIGIIPRALSHLFDELRMMAVEFTMRISYLELYNEELCDLLSTDDQTKIRIFDDSTKKGSVIIQGLEEIIVHSKDDVYKLLEKGKERRKTATTLMNAQSSRSHTVFSIVVHIRENGIEGEEMLKIGKLNLVDLAGSENVSKAGNEKGIRTRETVNINQSLLTLGRVITALVERTPHIPYRESKLTRLLQESLGGRTKTSIIATISPGHKDLEETLSTLEYAHRAKHIQNKPEVNQKLTKKTVIKEYTEEIDKLRRELVATRDKNGIYLPVDAYEEINLKMESQNRELNEKVLLLKAYKDELQNKEKIFNEVSLSLIKRTEELKKTEQHLSQTKGDLVQTKKVLDTTKRRYKEKTVLLESHVKTEKELTSQATQILEVADSATEDTNKLQKAIERRKHVDQQIISTTETFSQRMDVNFNMMTNDLQNFQADCNNSAQMIQEELTNCTSIQNRLLDKSEHNIETIKKACSETIAANQCMHEEFIDVLSNASGDHHAKLIKFAENFKNIQTQQHKVIDENLKTLTTLNLEQRTAIQALQSKANKEVTMHTANVQTLIQQMRDSVNESLVIAKSNIQDLVHLTKELNDDEKLIEKEQKLIDDFVLEMQKLKELRQNTLKAKYNNVNNLKSNTETDMKQMQESTQRTKEYGERIAADNDEYMRNFDAKVGSVLEVIHKNSEFCSEIQTQLDDSIKQSGVEFDNFTDMESKHFETVKRSGSDSVFNAKRICLEQEQRVIETVQTMSNEISNEMHLVRGHVAVSTTFVDDIIKRIDNYSAAHGEKVEICKNDLFKFKQSELKTYSPSGETPAKRSFCYPRTLATTSPDSSIIRRFRTENNWSDLDSTIQTIEEGSEAEDTDTFIFLRELSGTETLMNSTEVSMTALSRSKSDSNVQNNSTNLIKKLVDANRTNSLSLTGSLNATPNSSGTENKENVG